MKTASFIAETPAAALAQIHAELGPDAVVLSVRQLPAQGMARLLPGRHRVEVLAGIPEAESPNRERFPLAALSTSEPVPGSTSPNDPLQSRLQRNDPSAGWRSVAWLEEMGLLPAYAERLQTRLEASHNGNPPASVEEEWSAVSAALAAAWRPAPPLEDEIRPLRPHVFIGPPGSGKTTALCKWLTQAVLTQDRTARVWRLDAGAANTAEFLSLHCEMLGVPVERSWSAPDIRADLLFVDFPGTEAQDPAALTALQNQLAALLAPRVHLVLNAAYETNTLLAQWRAFEPFQPEDVILTHFDEEKRRIKLWNLVLGTNCTFRYLSGGQKIPGEFRVAAPAHFFPIENSR